MDVKTIKRISVALAVAFLLTLASSLHARAGGPYYISESSLSWI